MDKTGDEHWEWGVHLSVIHLSVSTEAFRLSTGKCFQLPKVLHDLPNASGLHKAGEEGIKCYSDVSCL